MRRKEIARELGRGDPGEFLPSGLFVRLMGKCVMWSESTSSSGNSTGGFRPELSKREAVLVFGADMFTMTELPKANAIRVRLAEKSTNPAPVVERLQGLIDLVLAECFPNLECSLLVPFHHASPSGETPSVNPARPMLDLDVVVQSLADNAPVWVGKKSVSPPLLRELCKLWLPPMGLLEAYDIFLSYRWVCLPFLCCCFL